MLALLYDIHGNLPALEAVLSDLSGRDVDRCPVGGDMAQWVGIVTVRIERAVSTRTDRLLHSLYVKRSVRGVARGRR
jgi:hypothetical protein